MKLSPDDIRLRIAALRRVKVLDRSDYDHALIALADLVAEAIVVIDDQAQCEMTGRQLHLLEDLRTAVSARRADEGGV